MSSNNPIRGEQDGREPPSDELLAGEYVLGVLDATERRAVEMRMTREPALARLVAEWERRLSPLCAEVAEADVAARIWPQICRRLGWTIPPARRGPWQSLGLWRAATALAAAAAIAAVLIGRFPSNPPGQPSVEAQPSTQPVIALARENGAPGWLASIDRASGALLLVPVPAAPDASGRVPELWLIPPGEAPRSLGLLSNDRTRSIVLPPELRLALKTGAALAVSLERPEGAPHGAPAGPIIAKGTI
jgi:anti-sigma-K factor RskA